jgi:hypothetical protein
MHWSHSGYVCGNLDYHIGSKWEARLEGVHGFLIETGVVALRPKMEGGPVRTVRKTRDASNISKS